jgi:hypothetical protein
MKIEIVNGKWSCSEFIIDYFINLKRTPKKPPKRCKITKEQNYVFKKNRINNIEVNL